MHGLLRLCEHIVEIVIACLPIIVLEDVDDGKEGSDIWNEIPWQLNGLEDYASYFCLCEIGQYSELSKYVAIEMQNPHASNMEDIALVKIISSSRAPHRWRSSLTRSFFVLEGKYHSLLANSSPDYPELD